ncbi:MAG: ribonuclease HI family protein [Candidatus Omnitrophica bacterium]|nr:ribonuclease HI family protein [Candidatus Omnitrophota bacterium]
MPKTTSQTYYIYTDGGARGNPGPAAIGVLICDEEGHPIQEHSDYIGEATNNVAEYCALIAALELAKQLDLKGSKIQVCMDSELVCRQLNGEYRIKSPELRKLYQAVKEAETDFESLKYEHVPRTHPSIRRVDRLLNLKLDQCS